MAKKKQKPGKQKPQSGRHEPVLKTPIKKTPKQTDKWTENPLTRVALYIIKPILFVSIALLLVNFNKGYERLYDMNFVRLFKDMEKFKGLSYLEKERRFFPASYHSST